MIIFDYYKCKLELKSNSNKILLVNCKFICFYTFLFCAESQTERPQVLSFVSLRSELE